MSVKDKPLIYTSPTGRKYPTEAGMGRFFYAIPVVMAHTNGEIGWHTGFVTLDDECNIRDADYDREEDEEDYDPYTINAEDITHYIPEPEPPKL